MQSDRRKFISHLLTQHRILTSFERHHQKIIVSSRRPLHPISPSHALGLCLHVFIAFAPMNKPKIAIAVFIENAGFGGTWAAPIANLMMEKYLYKKISDKAKEEKMMEANLD